MAVNVIASESKNYYIYNDRGKGNFNREEAESIHEQLSTLLYGYNGRDLWAVIGDSDIEENELVGVNTSLEDAWKMVHSFDDGNSYYSINIQHIRLQGNCFLPVTKGVEGA